MILPWKRKDVYSTNKQPRLEEVCCLLAASNIEYECKSTAHGPMFATQGRSEYKASTNESGDAFYIVYVHEDDFEKAKRIIADIDRRW